MRSGATTWTPPPVSTSTEFIVTTPLCCPSRGSIFTGRYTHNHHVAANAGDAVHGSNDMRQALKVSSDVAQLAPERPRLVPPLPPAT